MQIVEIDIESNARSGIWVRREPDSKVTIERLLQYEKQSWPRALTEEGMRMAERFQQRRKHCPPRTSIEEGMKTVLSNGQDIKTRPLIREGFESRSNATAESHSQLPRQSAYRVSTQ
jgi:hypothetical protein